MVQCLSVRTRHETIRLN